MRIGEREGEGARVEFGPNCKGADASANAVFHIPG